MDSFVARANIDHYLDLLNNSDVPARNRSAITQLLIEEVNKLGGDREQLEFAERKAAACRVRADRQRRLLDSFRHDTTEWKLAERLVVDFESLAQLVEGFCQSMRRRVSGSSLL